MAKFFGIVGIAVAGLAVLVGAYALNGAVLQQLWEWFVIPEIPGTSPLSLPAAIGIILVASFLTAQYRYQRSLDDEPKTRVLASAFGYVYAYPVVLLAIGYVVHSFE